MTAPAPKPTPVIRQVHGAEERHRALRKHVPAWVISGAVHVALIASLILADKLMGQVGANGKSAVSLTVVPPNEEEDEKLPVLTEPEIGLVPELEPAIEAEKLDPENAAPAPSEMPGFPDPSKLPTDILAAPGIKGELGTVQMGPGIPGVGSPDQFGGRRDATTRSQLAAKGGGSAESEAAVARGLTWLARNQRENGTWQYDGTSSDEVIASTAMGLLPFLAAGQTHNNPHPRENKYQKNVLAAVSYLIANQQPDGSFRGAKTLYAHGIATVALCEAFGLSKDKAKLLGPAQKACTYLTAAQGPNGSWGYRPNTNGDTSIVGWEVQALHSGELCKDLVVRKDSLTKAMAFLDTVSDSSSRSKYGYSDRTSVTPARTAIGLLCRYYASGWGPQHPGMAEGVSYLLKTWTPTAERFDMYYYYYATQVMHFYDGPEWHQNWNPKMRDLLIARQVSVNGRNDGSWDPDSGMIGSHCGRLGTTCLALLTLEVYYRHLPLYKRDTAGLRELER